MKRPLVLVGFSYLLTLVAAVYFGSEISIIGAVLGLLLFIVAMFVPKFRRTKIYPIVFLTVSLAFGSFFAFYEEKIEPVKILDGKDAIIEGTVVEAPFEQYGNFYYVLEAKLQTSDNLTKNIKIRLSSQSTLNAEPYSKIKEKVHLFLPKGGKGYSSGSYYASKGIQMLAYLYNYENYSVSPPQEKPLYYYALKLRSKLLKSVRMMYAPDEANLINSVIFGETTCLSDEVYFDFKNIGISHIMSVSGLHMATMSQLFMMIFLFLKFPKKLSSFLSALGVISFMGITCFVPSVTRSGIMCLLYLSGIILSRKSDALNSLSVAILIICLINPYAAADIGFLLSCSATLGIILYADKINNYLNDKYDKIKKISPLVHGINGILSTTLSAVLFTLPITILAFGSVSLLAPISNLLMLVASTLMLNFGAIAAVINLISPLSYFALPFAVSAGILSKYMQNCAHILAQISHCSIPESSGFVMLWLACTIFLFSITVFIMKNKKILKITALLSIIMLLTGVFSSQLYSTNVTRLAVLDIGTDESIVITRNKHAAVIGCGGYSSAYIGNYLKSQGIRCIDYIQPLTSGNMESKNTADLIKWFKTNTLTVNEDIIADSYIINTLPTVSRAERYSSAAAADLWDNVQIHTLCNGGKNAVYIEINNVSVLICPEKTEVSKLPGQWLYSDFVVADTVLENHASIDCVSTIFSMNEKDLQKNSNKLKKLNPIMTGGAGNVVLEFSGDRMIKIRRE